MRRDGEGRQLNDIQYTNLSLEQVLGILRRRAPWVLLCVVLVAGAGYGLSKHQTKKYTATASLVFGSSQPGQRLAALPRASNSNPHAQRSANLKLVQLGDVAAKTARRLGRGLTKQEVSAALRVSAQGESNIVNVSATATSPVLAKLIANTYTKQFVVEQHNSNRAAYAAALKRVNKKLDVLSRKQRAGAAGRALQRRAQSLRGLAKLGNGNVQIAQKAAAPTLRSSPTASRNTILGGVLGLLLGLGVVFLLARLDRRIREPEDLSAVHRLPLLGIVSDSKALARGSRPRKGGGPELLPPREEEAFQLIRARLRYFNIDRELRALLVASAAPGEGKTTIARHLAIAAARTGSVVLLIEADLRRPTLTWELDLQPGPGLSDVLIGSVSLWRATQPVALDQQPSEAGRPLALDVLVAGAPLPPNPAELIESRAMAAVLEQANETYDLVVVDTSALCFVSDAFPLLRMVDGVVIVGRVGRNRRRLAKQLHEDVDGLGARLLGVIANGCKARRRRSYHHAHVYGRAPVHGPRTYARDYTVGENGGRPSAPFVHEHTLTEADGPSAVVSSNGASVSMNPTPRAQP